MTDESLYNEMNKLVKRANQRLLSLERFTGLKGSFASKELLDYMEMNQTLTKSGSRIASSKNFTETQMLGVIKKTKEFLNRPTTIKQIKEMKKVYEQKFGKELTIQYTNTIYQEKYTYSWIYEYYSSDFWVDIAKPSKDYNWTEEQFTKAFFDYAIKDVEETRRNDVIDLYYYIMKSK